MALDLKFTLNERNDNKALILQDTTNLNTNTNSGWDDNAFDINSIGSTTNTLKVQITIQVPDGEPIIYNTINIFDTFAPVGGFLISSYPTCMKFIITPDMLIDPQFNPLGLVDSTFPDGIYNVEYIFSPQVGNQSIYSKKYYIDGISRNAVYSLLRTIPEQYMNTNMITYETYTEDWKYIQNIQYAYIWLKSIEASSYIAREKDILQQLQIVQNLIIDASNRIR
jgi:hypothetical protein